MGVAFVPGIAANGNFVSSTKYAGGGPADAVVAKPTLTNTASSAAAWSNRRITRPSTRQDEGARPTRTSNRHEGTAPSSLDADSTRGRASQLRE
jgi:hypothetical protein